MFGRKTDLAIINRSFWPVYPVIGEALLRFAEQQSEKKRICVIMQDHGDIRSKLNEHERGTDVDFYPSKAWSVSGSGIFRRILDSIFFMLWVLGVLIWTRPIKVYVSTDPPILVPFIVMLYAKLFRATYVYHLQDIHPEAVNVVMPLNKWIYHILKYMDSSVMRNAESLITITGEMAEEIQERSETKSKIHILSNPAVSFDGVSIPVIKKKGFTFCGNAGRLQRIPIIIDAINIYLGNGGKFDFVFAGGGVYVNALKDLAQQYSNVNYLGVVPPDVAAQLNADFEWALLPIEDEVTRYAFPSKSSSYVFSGAFVAAICGSQTSVAQWVKGMALGVVVKPDAKSLSDFFFDVENNEVDVSAIDIDRLCLKEQLAFDYFIKELENLVLNEGSLLEQ